MKPENLPLTVPILPLEAPLLLPATVVPFDADTAWRQNLATDVLAGDGYVGVVQLMEHEPGDSETEVFSVGCLGRMEEGRPENPDEYLIGGVVRFRIVEWLEPVRGYPRARIDWLEFEEDVEAIETGLPFATLRDIVRKRVEIQHPDFDFTVMERMAGTEIATALAHALPFSAAERQALMEAPHLSDIEGVLLQLMSGPVPFDLPPLPIC